MEADERASLVKICDLLGFAEETLYKELHEIALRDNLFEEEYDPQRAGYASGATKTYGGLKSEYFEEWRRKHLLKMFLRPRYIARMLTRAGSPKNTVQYAKAGAKRLRQLVLPKS